METLVMTAEQQNDISSIQNITFHQAFYILASEFLKYTNTELNQKTGVCLGFAGIAMQSILAGSFETFLNKILFYVSDSEESSDEEDEANDSEEDDAEFQEHKNYFLTFLQIIHLYMNPHMFTKLLKEEPYPSVPGISGIPYVFEVVKPVALDSLHISRTPGFSWIYSVETIRLYLRSLLQTITNNDYIFNCRDNKNIFFLLSNIDHVVLLNYNHLDKKWRFVDANTSIASMLEGYNIQQEQDLNNFTKEIFSAFQQVLPDEDIQELNNHIGFTTIVFYCESKIEEDNKQINELKWFSVDDVNYGSQEYLLWLAAFNKEKKLVESILQQNPMLNGNKKFGIQKYTALHCAAISESNEIIDILLNLTDTTAFSIKDARQRLPIYYAVLYSDKECVVQFLHKIDNFSEVFPINLNSQHFVTYNTICNCILYPAIFADKEIFETIWNKFYDDANHSRILSNLLPSLLKLSVIYWKPEMVNIMIERINKINPSKLIEILNDTINNLITPFDVLENSFSTNLGTYILQPYIGCTYINLIDSFAGIADFDIMNNHVQVIKILMEKGADVAPLREYVRNPKHQQVILSNGYTELISLLKADITQPLISSFRTLDMNITIDAGQPIVTDGVRQAEPSTHLFPRNTI